jgi:hypothetical protein
MNIDELNKFLQQQMKERNSMPQNDFLGITPNQMYGLIHSPLEGDSILKIKKNIPDEILSKIPFLLLTEHFLRILEREKSIKLTASQGNLPIKIVAELYEPKYILEEAMELNLYKQAKEEYLHSIQAIHINITLAGLAKKTAGKLSLTKKGESFVKSPQKRQELFEHIFKIFCTKYNWGYTDGFSFESIGQAGFAFSLLMMQNFGNESLRTNFYAEKYINAFPFEVNHTRKNHTQSGWYSDRQQSPEELRKSAMYCYSHRTFTHMMDWFGFVEINIPKDYMKRDETTVKKTAVLDAVFEGFGLQK